MTGRYFLNDIIKLFYVKTLDYFRGLDDVNSEDKGLMPRVLEYIFTFTKNIAVNFYNIIKI
jgi:hypothetical protein